MNDWSWQEIVLGIGAIVVIGAVAIGWIMFSTSQYQKVEDNPPSEYDIEEELETHLASTDVIIIESEQDDNVLLVKVWANGGIHLAIYKIKTVAQISYYWELESVAMIGVGERP